MAGVAVVVLLLIGAVVAVTTLLGGDDDGTALVDARGLPLEPGPTAQPDEEELFTTDVGCEEVGCTMVADGERVYVLTIGEQDVDTDESADSEVMAYDGSSGEPAWDDPVTLQDVYDMTSIEGTLLVAGDDGTTALATSDGEELWDDDGSPSGLLDGAALLIEYDDDSGDTSTRLVDLADGDERWKADGFVTACGDGAVAIDGEDVSRIDPSSGEETWSESVSEPYDVACDDDTVALLGSSEIEVLAMADGEDVGDIEVEASGEEESAGFAVADGDVIVASSGDLSRHRISGGDLEEVWSESGPDLVYDVTAIGDGGFLVIGEDEVEVFATSDGSSRGRVSRGEGYVETTSESLLVRKDDEVEAYRLSDLEDAWSIDVDGEDGYQFAVGGDRIFVIVGDDLTAYA